VKVGAARAAAARWVTEHARDAAWFRGAFFSGSTTWLPADAELPPGSDVDVIVVTGEEAAPPKLGKVGYGGVLVEVTYFPLAEISSAEQVLGNLHLAGSFRTDTIIADPTGHLRRLYAEVSRQFAEPVWVRRRCEHARRRIEEGLRAIDVSAPLHDQVTQWLFPTSITTLLILVAALRNPTVRLRYLAAREVLTEHGDRALYEELLRQLGCKDLTREQAQRHLDGLARTFDAVAEASRTPFFFSSDITPLARPIAIDASQQLIEQGNHRETVFWTLATYARCHKILATDAPELEEELRPAFAAALADFGITSPEEKLRRAEETLRSLPRLWETAEELLPRR
jgi:hypothetical protein